jgi:hypothetical protein
MSREPVEGAARRGGTPTTIHQIIARPVFPNNWQPTCTCGWAAGTCQKADTALKVGDQHLRSLKDPAPPAPPKPTPAPVDTTCPTPHKKRFRRQATAEDSIRSFWARAHPGKRMPHRVYQCRCGAWHTSSKPAPVSDMAASTIGRGCATINSAGE